MQWAWAVAERGQSWSSYTGNTLPSTHKLYAELSLPPPKKKNSPGRCTNKDNQRGKVCLNPVEKWFPVWHWISWNWKKTCLLALELRFVVVALEPRLVIALEQRLVIARELSFVIALELRFVIALELRLVIARELRFVTALELRFVIALELRLVIALELRLVIALELRLVAVALELRLHCTYGSGPWSSDV